MIERKLYMCEFCRTDYKDAKDCIACEAKHKTKLHIQDAVYKPFKTVNDGFPIKLVVVADDGSVASYHRG